MTETIEPTVERIDEVDELRDDEHRLGRHVNHDPRSRNYRVATAGAILPRMWTRHIPVFNQGDLGSCTGNAAVGVLGTDPLFSALADQIQAGLDLDEDRAIAVYSAATKLDDISGSYPPKDTGSDGLSVAKACQSLGYISGYTHAFSLDDVLSGLQSGPMIVGTLWYADMDHPDDDGVVTATGVLRGGHEYECVGVDPVRELIWFVNSWGDQWGKGGYFAYSYETMSYLLGQQGDATRLVPVNLAAPAPAPPEQDDAPYAGATVRITARINRVAKRMHASPSEWLNRHFATYFDLNRSVDDGDQAPAELLDTAAKVVIEQPDGTKYELRRDSLTGRFVSTEYADENPATTSHEHGDGDEDREVFRDTETGQFVSEQEAKEHPETTQRDHV